MTVAEQVIRNVPNSGLISIEGLPELDPVAHEAWYLDVDELEPADYMCDIIRWALQLEIVAHAYDEKTNWSFLAVRGDQIDEGLRYHVIVNEDRNEVRLINERLELVQREQVNHLDELKRPYSIIPQP